MIKRQRLLFLIKVEKLDRLELENLCYKDRLTLIREKANLRVIKLKACKIVRIKINMILDLISNFFIKQII